VNQSKRRLSRPVWGRSVPSVAIPLLFAILLLPGAALAQPRSISPAGSGQGAALHEGVLISPRSGLAYVMRPGGGIEAVSLANGAVRWRTDRASKPLALAGDRLVAQAEGRANTLQLVVLDARNGATRDSVRIPLPSGVSASVVDTAAGSFRVQAEGAGSDLVVRWEATGTEVLQGILPAEDEVRLPAVTAGEAVLDAASLRVKGEPAVRSVRSATISRASLEELAAPAVQGTEGRQMLSVDGRHVLVTETAEGGVSTLYRHRWTIYERASGARLGSVPALVSVAPFLVVGKTLYHTAPAHAVRREKSLEERPFSLRAMDLKTGAEAWTKAVRETDFRGPFPP